MPQLHLEDRRVRIDSSTPSVAVGMTARLGELTIVDDSDRSVVVNLINDLLTANIPVTTINDRQQGLPFQEVYHDFDGRYIHLNSTTLDLESIDPERDLLLEIPGHQLAAYLLAEDPILGSISRMLVKRFAAFPLSFAIVEEIKGIDNSLLKAYLERLLAHKQSRVKAIWSFQCDDRHQLPSSNYRNLMGGDLLGLNVNTNATNGRADSYDRN
jgi:hypothetical protein